MTRYQNIISIIISVFFLFVLGLLIWSNQNSDNYTTVKYRLDFVSQDSLNKIEILPINPDWKVNLTLKTIVISDTNQIKIITDALNKADKEFPGRGIQKTWGTFIILNYKNGKDIKLKIVESTEGICLFYTNTMMNPHYLCNDLKSILEEISEYKEPLGKK